MATVPHDELGYLGFAHPKNQQDVIDLVTFARTHGHKLRVRGALHSERGSVLAKEPGGIQVMLDHLTSVQINVAASTVRAGAGVSLGGDPYAPGAFNIQSRPHLSLFRQLHDHGLALPITGGVTHQTLSGFVSTGAAGGSLQRSFLDAVVELTLIDGNGNPRVIARNDPDFPAALVSLGLFGVLTELELKCEPTYDIVGFRSVQPVDDCDFNLFAAPAPGTQTLVDFLQTKEYARALWWPQPGVERVELWEASRFDARVHDKFIGNTPVPPQTAGLPGPSLQLLARVILSALQQGSQVACETQSGIQDIRQLLQAAPSTLPAALAEVYGALHPPGQLTPSEFLLVIADLIAQLNGIPPAPRWYPSTGQIATPPAGCFGPLSFEEQLISVLISLFVEPSPSAFSPWTDPNGFTRRYCAQLFRDPWYLGLAQDNSINERILPVTFTELWIPLDQAPAALSALHARFCQRRLPATGTFAIELYAAKASDAWLSPAYGRDTFRIDPFYFDDGNRSARDQFFLQFWDVLRPFGMRFHWGKALSDPASTTTGVPYRQGSLSQFPQFRQLRSAYDPQGVFLSDYWRDHLGL